MTPLAPATVRASALGRFASAYMVLLVLLVLSSAIYFGQAGEMDGDTAGFENPIKPSYIYFLTYGASLVIGLGMIRASRVRVPRDGFISLFLVLGLMHLAWAPFSDTGAATARTLVMRVNVVVMTICCQIILAAVTDMRAILRATRCIVLGSCLLNALVILAPELFQVRMAVFPGRAAGLYWDPNQCATFLAMLLPLISYGLGRSMRVVQSLAVLIGIFFTFSREGVVLWSIAVLLCELMQPGKPTPKALVRNSVVVGGSAILLLGTLWLGWGALIELLHPYLNSDTYSRLLGTDEGSSGERLLVLQLGWDVFAENPVFGAGYAATRTWGYSVSVHNMFILMLAEFGAIGGLWYVAFLCRVFVMPLRFGVVLGCLVGVESLFSHSYFDLCYYMLLILLYWRFSSLIAASQGSVDGRSVRASQAARLILGARS